jgi:hypothetical protein
VQREALVAILEPSQTPTVRLVPKFAPIIRVISTLSYPTNTPTMPRPLIWLTAASAVSTVTAASISPLDGNRAAANIGLR